MEEIKISDMDCTTALESQEDRIQISIGDFRKNAGIVGLWYVLQHAKARKDVDYGITEDHYSLWVSKQFLLEQDLTVLCFDTYITRLGKTTTYQRILDTIDSLLEFLEKEETKLGKEEKEKIKFINEKLLSNSYKSGFDTIKNKIEQPEIYEQLMKDKLKDKMERQELVERLQQLKQFLKQEDCKTVFTMKSLAYSYINRFWDGKSFLNKNYSKKDMAECFTKDFIDPLKKYLNSDLSKAKDLCFDCGEKMGTKDRISIAFMTECADDLSRKKSAFWNGKVDAEICPVCNFLYSLLPLGFEVCGNQFIFLNVVYSVEQLIQSNDVFVEKYEDEEEKSYSSWIVKMLSRVLENKGKELHDLSVIVRGTSERKYYQLQIISKDVLSVISYIKRKKEYEKLKESPNMKLKDAYINLYEQVIENILCYRNQYSLLNRLIKENIDTELVATIKRIEWIYKIQIQMNEIIREIRNKKGKRGIMEETKDNIKKIGVAGKDFRTTLLGMKNTKSDDCLRGTIYQLLNALSVKNQERFLDIVLRMYCSIQKEVPNGFLEMIGKEEKFLEYGYAFVIGLKSGDDINEQNNHQIDEELVKLKKNNIDEIYKEEKQ